MTIPQQVGAYTGLFTATGFWVSRALTREPDSPISAPAYLFAATLVLLIGLWILHKLAKRDRNASQQSID